MVNAALWRHPVELIQDGNQVIAGVIDVPAAITFGEDREQALQESQDALVVALSGYMSQREAIPQDLVKGSRPNQGEVQIL